MTTQKVYGASYGPFLYNDDELLNDTEGDFPSMNRDASMTYGYNVMGGVRLLDTDQSNFLTITWDEDDTANRTLGLLVGGGNRTLTLHEDLTLADGYDFTLQALGQANQLTLNENFIIGDGFGGTLTFSADSKTLTVEDDSYINQDVTTDASPTFEAVTLTDGVYSILYPEVLQDTGDPTGFENITDSTLAFNNGTRQFTIDVAVDEYTYYRVGNKITKTGASNTTIADSTGLHYIYFDSNDALQNDTSWTFGAGNVLVAMIYYDTDTLDEGIVMDERHGFVMDWKTHYHLHECIGAMYEDGFSLSFADATFTIGAGEFHDEDVSHVIAQQTTCKVLYRQSVGSPSEWTWDDSVPTKYYMEDGGSDLLYDNAGTPTAVAANQYMAMWIFVTNDIDDPIWAVMGQRTDTTIAAARLNNTIEGLDLSGLPSVEALLLARVILRNDATPYEEYVDYRGSLVTGRSAVVYGASNVASGITTDVTNFDGILSATDTDVQVALETIDDHLHDGQTLQLDGVNSDGGAFAFTTTGLVTFSQSVNLDTVGTDEFQIGGNRALAMPVSNLNIAIGYHALNAAATAGMDGNIAIGYAALELANSASADFNTAIGVQALASVVSGQRNVGIGYRACYATTGSENIAVGFKALEDNVAGGYNIAIGTQTLMNQIGVLASIGIGYRAGEQNVSGEYPIAIGYQALLLNTTGDFNTAVGFNALTSNTEGSYNIGLGSSSLGGNTTGNGNIGIGGGAGYFMGDGDYNIAIGTGALYGVTGNIHHYNVGIGFYALYDITTGEANFGLGYKALENITSGDYNIAIGYQAGDLVTTGSSNIIIGYDIDPSAADASSELNIGGSIFGDLGNDKIAIGAMPLTNECDMGLLGSGVLALKETSTPTADADHGKVYTKNDNILYFQDGAGSEHPIPYMENGSAAGEVAFWSGTQWSHTETTELFWDDTNKWLGIGLAAPEAMLHIEAEDTDVLAKLERINSSVVGGVFRFVKARGTSGARTQPQVGDDVGQFQWTAIGDDDAEDFGAVLVSQVEAIRTATDIFDVASNFVFRTTNTGFSYAERVRITADGEVGIGTASPAGKLHVDQSLAAGAMQVLVLDQADVSEEFLKLIGESAADASQSLVDAADMTTPGSIVGWFKIYVEDVQATNPITDDTYYVPFYSAPTS